MSFRTSSVTITSDPENTDCEFDASLITYHVLDECEFNSNRLESEPTSSLIHEKKQKRAYRKKNSPVVEQSSQDTEMTKKQGRPKKQKPEFASDLSLFDILQQKDAEIARLIDLTQRQFKDYETLHLTIQTERKIFLSKLEALEKQNQEYQSIIADLSSKTKSTRKSAANKDK